jgi:serine/threonine protein kinase
MAGRRPRAAHPEAVSHAETAPLDGPPQPAPASLKPDVVLAGRYRVVQHLGTGGMGEVYEALDLELAVPVALKTVRYCPAGCPAWLDPVKREVRLARQVTHPCVCRMYDFGRDPALGLCFLTMELLSGQRLSDRIDESGRLAAKKALPLARQMASGLDAAHGAGVVHGDFKCGNVMLVGRSGRRAVVTDFGLARSLREALPRGSPSPRRAGTPGYMAPEQVRGDSIDAAADIYALGVVLFEMLTGRLPFEGDNPMRTAQLRLERDAPSPRDLVPEIPSGWEDVILHCLRRRRRERLPGARAVLAALAPRGR